MKAVQTQKYPLGHKALVHYSGLLDPVMQGHFACEQVLAAEAFAIDKSTFNVMGALLTLCAEHSVFAVIQKSKSTLITQRVPGYKRMLSSDPVAGSGEAGASATGLGSLRSAKRDHRARTILQLGRRGTGKWERRPSRRGCGLPTPVANHDRALHPEASRNAHFHIRTVGTGIPAKRLEADKCLSHTLKNEVYAFTYYKSSGKHGRPLFYLYNELCVNNTAQSKYVRF
ncbi:hypothetical protein NDU88_001896 [Pleurodeles waltl]|uniref:Uncharacterized protein n=1 Tax=Pleurodeles waltl TaxID=8319 RepID=A0AAV7V9N2_PLEWA|nr:hypothetical protein NDU88_001896 [Pleurodeles waltl]